MRRARRYRSWVAGIANVTGEVKTEFQAGKVTWFVLKVGTNDVDRDRIFQTAFV